MKAVPNELAQRLGGNIDASRWGRPGPAQAGGTLPRRPGPRWTGQVPGLRPDQGRPGDRARPDRPRPRPAPQGIRPEALGALAASLKARGQLQPIRVRWDGPSGRWVIVAGERR